MHDKSLDYVINNYIAPAYFEPESNQYTLEETEEQGKSLLMVSIEDENFCIKKYDDKKRCAFFKTPNQAGKNDESVSKCVDHVIMQHKNGAWRLHLIEMKSSVGAKTWERIKKQNRDAYLEILALSGVLGINFSEITSYTTYESEKFKNDDTNPLTKTALLGKKASNGYEQWESGYMELSVRAGKPLQIKHNKIRMVKDNNVLQGSLNIC